MGVRVRLVLAAKGSPVLEAVALLNGGFETEEPAVLLPRAAAERLFGAVATSGTPVQCDVADGIATLHKLSARVHAQVDGGDRKGPSVSCVVYVAEHEREVLASDSAIDAFSVVIRSFGKGTWRFPGERSDRPSEPAQLW